MGSMGSAGVIRRGNEPYGMLQSNRIFPNAPAKASLGEMIRRRARP